MSEQNLALVRSIFDAWNARDLASMAPHLAEDLHWIEVGGRPEGGDRRGREEVLAALETLFDAWEEYRLEPSSVSDAGPDRVVAVVREVARGRTSGAEVASDWGYVMTVSDGRLTRVEAYRDPRAALDAAGLRE
jgi:ketosteroid isomerase-like protein